MQINFRTEARPASKPHTYTHVLYPYTRLTPTLRTDTPRWHFIPALRTRTHAGRGNSAALYNAPKRCGRTTPQQDKRKPRCRHLQRGFYEV